MVPCPTWELCINIYDLRVIPRGRGASKYGWFTVVYAQSFDRTVAPAKPFLKKRVRGETWKKKMIPYVHLPISKITLGKSDFLWIDLARKQIAPSISKNESKLVWKINQTLKLIPKHIIIWLFIKYLTEISKKRISICFVIVNVK